MKRIPLCNRLQCEAAISGPHSPENSANICTKLAKTLMYAVSHWISQLSIFRCFRVRFCSYKIFFVDGKILSFVGFNVLSFMLFSLTATSKVSHQNIHCEFKTRNKTTRLLAAFVATVRSGAKLNVSQTLFEKESFFCHRMLAFLQCLLVKLNFSAFFFCLKLRNDENIKNSTEFRTKHAPFLVEKAEEWDSSRFGMFWLKWPGKNAAKSQYFRGQTQNIEGFNSSNYLNQAGIIDNLSKRRRIKLSSCRRFKYLLWVK